MKPITLAEAQESNNKLNRDIYAAIQKCLKTFEEETGLQPSRIDILMSPFKESYELDTVHCKVELL